MKQHAGIFLSVDFLFSSNDANFMVLFKAYLKAGLYLTRFKV